MRPRRGMLVACDGVPTHAVAARRLLLHALRGGDALESCRTLSSSTPAAARVRREPLGTDDMARQRSRNGDVWADLTRDRDPDADPARVFFCSARLDVTALAIAAVVSDCCANRPHRIEISTQRRNFCGILPTRSALQSLLFAQPASQTAIMVCDPCCPPLLPTLRLPTR